MDDAMKAKLKPIFSMAIMKKEKDSKDENLPEVSPEVDREVSFQEEALMSGAEEMISAIESKDAKGLMEALCAFLENYDMTEEELPVEEPVKE